MISVIIPVYNAQPYLHRCIDSVLASAYSDFEIILVNDGSTDRSPEICRAYAETDSRVIYISQENQGVSAARNRGLAAARGEWIVFLDSDDFITDDYLSLTAGEAYREQDMILFRFALHASSSSRPESGAAAGSGLSGAAACADADCLSPDFPDSSGTVAPDSAPKVRDGQGAGGCAEKALLYRGEEIRELISRILVPRPLPERQCAAMDFRTPCARAYRRSIIERYSIAFSTDIRIGEDLLFNLEYQLHVKSCACIPRTVYFYDIHGDSSSHHFNPGLRENHARLLRAVRETLEKSGLLPGMERDYCSYALENLTYVLIREIFSPLSPRPYRESRGLCRKMRRDPLYREALRYNLSTGILPRRVLAGAFRLRCYLLTALISRVSYAWLERR